ncbi:hypothetical protein [Herbaspirillum sp. YR522]|uniref:hypothetical protein n=1 Tax=Herbaspirillum sp. YR522 TaxID=1144342 RepID=UPI00026F87FB|nr:hypothetical protein [Herbaspirillum sp. YR522]EJN09095.1 hypothetical protein PMI40_00920 [Herbaspirillum sp. YR522]
MSAPAGMNPSTPRAWDIDGPRLLPCNEVQVYAYAQGCMIGMLDGQLIENHVTVTMVYVSPPWRGSLVLQDMLAALKLCYRHVGRLPRGHANHARRT